MSGHGGKDRDVHFRGTTPPRTSVVSHVSAASDWQPLEAAVLRAFLLLKIRRESAWLLTVHNNITGAGLPSEQGGIPTNTPIHLNFLSKLLCSKAFKIHPT